MKCEYAKIYTNFCSKKCLSIDSIFIVLKYLIVYFRSFKLHFLTSLLSSTVLSCNIGESGSVRK